MKKKLSRLLCALLVMTMVLAMVPAVSAEGTGKSADDPIVLYDGQTSSDVPKCTGNHTLTATFYEVFGSTESKTTKYVSFNSKTGLITAKDATYKNGTWGVVKAVFSCKNSDLTDNVRYYKVFDNAKSITLTDESGTKITNSLRATAGGANVYFTGYTGNPALISVSTDDKTIATAEINETGYSAKKPYFTVTAVGEGTTTLYVTIDQGRSTEKTTSYLVITGRSGVLTLKKGTEVISQSNYRTDEVKDGTLSASVDDTLTLTPSADSTLGNVSDVKWVVNDAKDLETYGLKDETPADVTFEKVDAKTKAATFRFERSGVAVLKAKLGTESAVVIVNIVSNIRKVAIEGTYTDDKALIDDGQMNNNGKLNLSVKVTPDANKGDAVSAKWTITSGSDFVAYEKNADSKIDVDDNTVATGKAVTLKAKRAGTFTIKVELGGKSDELTMKINKQGTVIQIKRIPTNKLRATVRAGTADEIVQQMNENVLYNSITAIDSEGYNVQVPVRWYDAQISSDKKSATVSGYAVTTREGDTNTYEYDANCSKNITAEATLTDDAAVTKVEITSSKDLAIADDRVTLTANAEVMPSNATVKYQWYVNGKSVKDATSKTYTYTIPKASSDSSTSYKFKCEVTATYKGESTSTMSKEYTVSVSRDYAVSVSTSTGKTSFTVGDKPELEATLTYKGSKVSNPSVTWKIYDEKENSIDSNVATLSASGSTATLTTKAVKNASGDKIVVRATISANGQSFSSSTTLTIKPAEASTVKQSVGSGAALKASNITSAITKAAGSNAKLSYIIFNTPKSCTLQKSSSSSSSIGDTKCYVSTTSGQKLSDVYVKTSASSASVTYTAYDADDYVLATGTVSFDANDSGDTITASGASLKTIGAADQITGEYAKADYVKFDLPRASEGKLYYDYTTISDFGGEVKESDKYYLDASSSQNDIEDVYFLPAAGVTGKFKIDYTAYSSSNSDLGSGTITVNIKSKTSSDKFTDVSTKTGFQWAADSIDFGADNGIIKGATTYTFAPSQSLTRAQLVTILYRAAGSPSVSGVTNPFKDTKSDYYTNAMLWAYKNSIVTGTSATTFSPDSPVTREQIAAILYRYMGSPTATGSLTGFTDRANVSTYATTAMQWAIGKGYITGIGTKLDPKGNATRAQVAVIIHRFLTK